MPTTVDLCFKKWWKDLPNEHQVCDILLISMDLKGEFLTMLKLMPRKSSLSSLTTTHNPMEGSWTLTIPHTTSHTSSQRSLHQNKVFTTMKAGSRPRLLVNLIVSKARRDNPPYQIILWERICEIEAKPSKTQALEEELSTLKHCFTLLLSANFQMQKLLHYWGRSPQPGSTYYLQKLT